MSVHENALDGVTLDWNREMPIIDPEPKSWYNFLHSNKENAVECPLSKIRLTGKSHFMLVQETERWLLVQEEENQLATFYIFDKQTAKDGAFRIETETAAFVLKEQSRHEYLFQFLPNQKGVFVLQSFDEKKQVKLHFWDLDNSKNSDLHQLCSFPGSLVDYWYSPHVLLQSYQSELTTPRDFVVPYEGTLWLNYHERELIPSWTDLSAKGVSGVRQEDMKTLRLRPAESKEIDEGLRTFRLYRSDNGRFVAHFLSQARIVCDLLTGKTHIVEDRGWKNCVGASFVGENGENGLPKFYTFSQRWLAALEWSWGEGPEEFLGYEDEEDEEDEEQPDIKERILELVKKTEEFQQEDEDTWECNVEELKATVTPIDDQDEGPYGAGRYSDHGTDCESFSENESDPYGEFSDEDDGL